MVYESSPAKPGYRITITNHATSQLTPQTVDPQMTTKNYLNAEKITLETE